MNGIDPNKNCHAYCFYRKQCRYAEGSKGLDPEDCGMYYRLEDLMEEARDAAREQRRIRAEELGVDEREVDDW